MNKVHVEYMRNPFKLKIKLQEYNFKRGWIIDLQANYKPVMFFKLSMTKLNQTDS